MEKYRTIIKEILSNENAQRVIAAIFLIVLTALAVWFGLGKLGF